MPAPLAIGIHFPVSMKKKKNTGQIESSHKKGREIRKEEYGKNPQ
jgi:hypothetical protein